MVNLTGISINGKSLKLGPDAFQRFYIDLGSPHSALVQTVYDAVKGQITQYFSKKYFWRPKTPQPGDLDLCYEVPRGN